MKKMTKVMLGAVLALGIGAMAQDQPAAGREGRGRGERRQREGGGAEAAGQREGMRGRFDPERAQQMRAQRLRETIGASEEEWQVMEPVVQNIMAKRRELMAQFGGRRARQGGAEAAPQGMAAWPETEALGTALESETATAEEVTAKLAAFRAARNRKEQELKGLQEELRKLLTAKQEAQLVLQGTLE